MSSAIIIFVRNPEKGKVKTRLAATLGEEKALEIYMGLLEHTKAITRGLTGVSRYVFYAGSINGNDTWSKDDYHKMVQHNGDLGQKMYYAFKDVFAQGHDKVLIIGSDCPGLTSDSLQTAFDKLSNCDVVIGPANDGGYYLLGLKNLEEAFFLNKQWSTESVYAATLEDIQNLGLSYWSLPELVDIDTEEDWKLAQARIVR